MIGSDGNFLLFHPDCFNCDKSTKVKQLDRKKKII